MNRILRFTCTCFFTLLLLIAPVRAEETFTEVNESVEFLYSVNRKAEVIHLIKSKRKAEPQEFSIDDKIATNYENPQFNLPKLFLLHQELKLCE